MKQKIDKPLIISTLLCLVPIVLSLVMYDKLPDQIAVHWTDAGNPDNYLSKPLAAFGLPVFLAVINLIVHISINNDPKKANSSQRLKAISKWSVPVLSVVIMPVTLFIAMGVEIPVHVIIPAMVGILLAVVGNYLPKCRQNYTVGIKLPWTLNSEENWNKTHRLAGYIWIAGGILLAVNAFLNLWIIMFIILIVITATPIAYSFILYKKGI